MNKYGLTSNKVNIFLSSYGFIIITVEPLLYDHPQNHIGVVV